MTTEFKEFSKLKELDKINLCLVSIDTDGTKHKFKLEDFYNNIAKIKLDEIVPKKIVTQFDVAKNLSVYSCFVYRFHQPAKMQAYSTLEFALKDVFGAEKKGFRCMLKKSFRLDLITKKYFTRDINADNFKKILLETMPYLRNNIAHGSSTLSNDSPEILIVCSNLINELYKNKGLVKK